MGCGLFGRDSETDERAVRPGEPKPSPSGLYTAYAEDGAPQNTVKTLVDVIRDKDGNEVYRDDAAYSTRHGVLFTWLSTEPNQLWILSSDVGTFHVAPDNDGTWTKQHATNVPPEIKDLRGY
ncbi:hypothetical protein A7U43_04040 [Mycobacterium adipatum]|uniref:Uncharacterized protein n=1 Tax=Mycobacterium adipatum TaxID=1682113 RepID=A0A172UTU4_9MYCO|nr:hypothetical protein A7U43_04040 [Mycobacterium adipatum]MAS03579.1 hypothetical protein [Ahrensia sp.]PQP45345.1 hypothetical protein C6A88_20280 [Mycolicibacterium austroafricanum]